MEGRESKRRPIRVWILFQVLSLIRIHLVSCYIRVPDVPYEAYVENGDVNIGLLSYAHLRSSTGFCGEEFSMKGFQHIIAGIYAISKVNEMEALLPNIKLGFVAVDHCRRDITALSRALYFVSDTACSDEAKVGGSELINTTEDLIGMGYSKLHGRVIGMVGPDTSRQGVMVASVLSLFQLPILSTFATSDDLGDKSRFGYFMRLVPPDSYQSRAMIDVLVHFGWTYFSLLFYEGSYGENGGRLIEKLAKEKGMCVAYSHRISSDSTEEDFREIVSSLWKYKNARAVVVYANDHSFLNILKMIAEDERYSGWFIWIGADFMNTPLDYGARNPILNHVLGSVYIGFPYAEYPGFREHFESLTWINSTNPWIQNLWEYTFSCSWEVARNESNSCTRHERIGEADSLTTVLSLSKMVDGVFVYAHALHDLITDECPAAFNDSSVLHGCLSGSLLLSYMKKVNIDGVVEPLSFDEKGDLKGQYVLKTVTRGSDGIYFDPVVGQWDRNTEEVVLNEANMSESFQHLVGWDATVGMRSFESICSKPCEPKTYYQYLDQVCCWECRTCRDNERISGNLSSCQLCEEFTWPDNDTATSCVAIEPSFLRYADSLGIGLILIACIGGLGSLAVSAVFIKHREKRLIKSTSRELSAIILIGSFLASVLSIIFVLDPTGVVCLLRDIGFHLSVCLIYTPLLVKTARILWIFTASKKSAKSPRFISTKAQLVMVTILMTFLIILMTVFELVYTKSSTLYMPIRTIRYVELTCKRHLVGFLVPLCYNIITILLCAVFGFMTRKLPENFNDSWYIFVSVSTTLFMWAVFLPTYFTAFYAYYQEIMLALCLLLNSFVTVGCQYAPKVYAIYWVNEQQIRFTAVANVTEVKPSSNPSTVRENV